jgi:hypothetical protein
MYYTVNCFTIIYSALSFFAPPIDDDRGKLIMLALSHVNCIWLADNRGYVFGLMVASDQIDVGKNETPLTA